MFAIWVCWPLYSQCAGYHVENWMIRLNVLSVIILPSIWLDLLDEGNTKVRFIDLKLQMSVDTLRVKCYSSYFWHNYRVVMCFSSVLSPHYWCYLERGVKRPSVQFQIKSYKLKCDRRNQRGMLENVLRWISLTGWSISAQAEVSYFATFYWFCLLLFKTSS